MSSTNAPKVRAAIIIFSLCICVMFAAQMLASQVQCNYGDVAVTNAEFTNEFGKTVRAKLFRPHSATTKAPAAGVVFVHGYQSVRETGDSLSIELARRGVVVLSIDMLGRGNSDVPGINPDAPDFDKTFGVRAALSHLRSLSFVNPKKVGMVGHSLGAETSFQIALGDERVKALVVIGYAYTAQATPSSPNNMLMIFGRYDEFRGRMTQTDDFLAEWMASPQTQVAISHPNPKFETTYGDFGDGTARRVVAPAALHVQETHNKQVVSETIAWINKALRPAGAQSIDPTKQIWPIKEWATLCAMLACLIALLPLAVILTAIRPFASLRAVGCGIYACSRRDYLKHSLINGFLMWLYLPAALIIFGIHKYLVHIDGVFPMMVVNATVWWFILINIIGFFLTIRWYKKLHKNEGITLSDLGISFAADRLFVDKKQMGLTVLLGAILFGFAYLSEYFLEALFIVDFRFIFAFASDLTPYRVGMFLLYFPLFLLGFVQLGFFLHCQLRPASAGSWLGTYWRWSLSGTMALVIPLILFLAIQYVPLFAVDAIPLVGPGGMFVLFIINLFHMVMVLAMIVPVSTWLSQLTGRPYLGAFVNAALVTWMFTSSQVIAPVPV